MNPFWTWMALWIPHSIAPNMVTLSALVCTSAAVIACLVNDTTFEAQLPSYMYFMSAAAVFIF